MWRNTVTQTGDKGRRPRRKVRSDSHFHELALGEVIAKTFEATLHALKDFVYEAIPEITDMKWGEITPEKVEAEGGHQTTERPS